MSILTLLLVLILIGVIVWAATTYIPMDASIKNIIRIVGIIIAIVYALNAFGILGSAGAIKVPTVR